MTPNTPNCDMEQKIIEAAKSLFIEKGFAETSMSEIAAKVGINRPALHYYFRTKERMFQAVFGMIIEQIIPRVQDFVTNRSLPVEERIGGVVDIYFHVLGQNPDLPLFAMREIQRDPENLFASIEQSPMRQTVSSIAISLEREMNEGGMKQVPLSYLFYNFYGLVTLPFLTKNLAERLMSDGKTFEELLAGWKPYIVMQIKRLLEP